MSDEQRAQARDEVAQTIYAAIDLMGVLTYATEGWEDRSELQQEGWRIVADVALDSWRAAGLGELPHRPTKRSLHAR